jgi:hypothetical protein
MGIEEQKEQRLPITPGLPEHAEEVLYRQAGRPRTPETPEQQADAALDILHSGQTWHLSHDLNGPAHHAARTGDRQPLIKAINRSRQPKP